MFAGWFLGCKETADTVSLPICVCTIVPCVCTEAAESVLIRALLLESFPVILPLDTEDVEVQLDISHPKWNLCGSHAEQIRMTNAFMVGILTCCVPWVQRSETMGFGQGF